MKKRILAKDLAVSSIGYGAMGLSEFYGDTDDNQSLALLHNLLDLGIDFIDTADMYGDGHNEQLIGKFLASLTPSDRQQFTIATKCGIQRLQTGGYSRAINNSPVYIRQCCDASLQRLGVETLDLFYLHRIDKAVPIEESIGCLADLVKQGKIRHIGLCEVSATTLKKAHTTFPITAVQTEYSLWTRDIEAEILPVIKELEIGLVPYSPLGRGFLTGKYVRNQVFADNDFRKNNERFSQDNLTHNLQLLQIIEPIAEKYHATTGQIALAWLLAQYDKLVPIPGTKTQQYLVENAKSADIILEESDIQRLNHVSNQLEIKGNRYNSEGMKGVNA